MGAHAGPPLVENLLVFLHLRLFAEPM